MWRGKLDEVASALTLPFQSRKVAGGKKNKWEDPPKRSASFFLAFGRSQPK